jgi:hypothetical protein
LEICAKLPVPGSKVCHQLWTEAQPDGRTLCDWVTTQFAERTDTVSFKVPAACLRVPGELAPARLYLHAIGRHKVAQDTDPELPSVFQAETCCPAASLKRTEVVSRCRAADKEVILNDLLGHSNPGIPAD